MRNTCAVGFLAVTLALVACLSANATVTEATARKAVEDAQKYATQVSDKAKGQLSNAKFILQGVESSKRKAEQAASHAEEAAKGNTKAETIAEKIKNLSKTVVKLYQNAKEKLDNAVNSLDALLSEAEELKGESDITISPNEDSPNDYTDTNKKASDLKKRADELDENITDALKLKDGVNSIVENMDLSSKEAQIADCEVDIIVTVAKIETMIRDADARILKTEKKRKEVNDIVQEMKELSKTAPKESLDYINRLCMSAENELIDFSVAIENDKKAKEAMMKQKEFADAALVSIKKTVKVSNARSKVTVVESSVIKVAKLVTQLESALQTAESSVLNANNRKQDVVRALSKSNSEYGNEEGKVTEKDGTANPKNGVKAFTHGFGKGGAATISVPLLVTLIACAVLH